MWIYVILIAVLVLLLVNLGVLVLLSAHQIRHRERQDQFNSELLDAIEYLAGSAPPEPTIESHREKTWDQKYEEELDAMHRRMRGDSGLKDLPDPGLSWGEPPAPNPANADGLIIQDK